MLIGVLGLAVLPIDEKTADEFVATEFPQVAQGDPGTTTPTTAGSEGGPTTSAGPGDTATGAAPVAGSGAPGSAGASAGATCPPTPESEKGVTDNEITVAIILINAIGPTANAAFGVPTPAEQQRNWEAVIADQNASGGVACRQLVPKFFSPNAVNQSSLQQGCLDVAQAGVFAVLDNGGYTAYPQLAKCFPEAGLPYWAGYALPLKLQRQYYPYLFSGSGVVDVAQRNFVFALNQRGWFRASNGFQKLGIVYRDCSPELYPQFVGHLHAVGLTDSQIRSRNLGCSGATPFGNPIDIQQAVFDFKNNGVTHVTFLDDNPDFGPFTNSAESQDWRPKYAVTDQNTIGSANSATSNYNANNLNGALGITPTRYGEPDTPGLTPTGATSRCNAIYQKRGRPPSHSGQGVPGVACSELWGLVASIQHAPVLRRDALATGLQAAGSLDLSFPYGPADFTAPGTTTGGQFWRTVQYASSCRCWRVLGDPKFQPGFP